MRGCVLNTYISIYRSKTGIFHLEDVATFEDFIHKFINLKKEKICDHNSKIYFNPDWLRHNSELRKKKISADERPQTYALDRAATGTGERASNLVSLHLNLVADELT